MQGKTTQETRYYISDENEPKAICFNALARGHWGIENQLHWHLDVTFKEDHYRSRTGYASQSLFVLRELALQITSNQNDRLSTKRKLYKAALNSEYLKKGWKLSVVLQPKESSKKFQILPLKWIVERTFSQIENYRRITADNEYKTESVGTMLQIILCQIMLKNLLNKF